MARKTSDWHLHEHGVASIFGLINLLGHELILNNFNGNLVTSARCHALPLGIKGMD